MRALRETTPAIDSPAGGIPKRGTERQESVRYNLELGADLYEALQKIAEQEQRPVAELVRRFIKLGLVVQRVQQSGGGVILREGDRERELLML